MIKLPHWVITDKLPALYDHESGTAIEQTAKIYGAMNQLIDEYNQFVDHINETIETFIKERNGDYEVFKVAIRQEFQDFIDKVDLKMKYQDGIISDAVNYMKTNLRSTIRDMIAGLRETGELNEDILACFADFAEQIASETTLRENADNALQRAIESEVTTRESADQNLQTAIDNEVATRENADQNLQTAIDNEVTTRENADQDLQTAIDNEVTTRENADQNLQTAIDNEVATRENEIRNLSEALEGKSSFLNNAIPYVTPQMYGAVGDGVTDDSDAIQRAIDSGYPVMFPHSKNEYYLIKKTIHVGQGSAGYLGANRLALFGPGILLSDGAYISVDIEYGNIENLCIVALGKSYGNFAPKAIECLNLSSEYDCDVTIKNCCFSYFDNAIIIHGRGAEIDGCLFTFSKNGIHLNYTAQNTNVLTTDKVSGARGYIVRNCKFHGMSANCVETRNGSTVTGMVFENNMCDIGNGGIDFYGDVYHSQITNNVFSFSSLGTIYLGGIVDGLLIDGNTVFNKNDIASCSYPSSIISAPSSNTNTIKNLTIVNNLFRGCTNNGIDLMGANGNENIIISNNVFKELALNGNKAYAPINCGEGLRRSVITGNVFCDAPYEGYCIRTEVSDERVSNNIIMNNSIAPNSFITPSWVSVETNKIQEY